MDNQISVDWDTITGAYDWAPLFPITLIDTEVLDYWCTHPTVWEVARNLQHSRWVLAIVRRTLPEGNKGKPAVVFRASLVYIPARQSRTNLSDALSYLKWAKGDCVVLVSMPINAHHILLNLKGTGTLLYYPSTATQAWTMAH